MTEFAALKTAMAELDEVKFNAILDEVLFNGGSGVEDALNACQEGMSDVGRKFEEGVYYVGDLIYAGEMLTKGMEKIKPMLGGKIGKKVGKLIICTVHGDLHDIGKNIVKAIMEAGGFEVLDLGIDTPVDKIVSTAKDSGIKVIALSGVLTLALDSMRDTVEGFKAAGIRDDVKIIVGGNPLTAEACNYIGADAWTRSPQKGVEICRAWVTA